MADSGNLVSARCVSDHERMPLSTAVVQVVESELRLNHIACYPVVLGEASDSGQEIEVRTAEVIDDDESLS
jgi:hypothetical protein